jgi:thymidine phosphorylase
MPALTESAEGIIRLKREGQALTRAQLNALVEGISHRSVSDVQLGAFLMAVYLKGMNADEQAGLTLAMRDSGTVLQWGGLDGPVLDKHSTGGVGDLVSLVLAPLVAACGAYVPMISGRGLGHTGGTLDKLESIPGFNVNPGLDALRRIVREAGLAMVGQGPELAPADRRMYAARDVSATVSCTPLIVASILSKKLAEGLDGLVMDIKTGNGAVMADEPRARELGESLVAAAAAAGLPCTALFTDMNQPLASSAGNALELAEALRFLRNEPVNARLREVVFALAAELLLLGNIDNQLEAAHQRLERQLANGSAAERFARMVALQGGPADLLERHSSLLPRAAVRREVQAAQAGYVQAMDTRRIGRTVVALGGGRSTEADAVDPSVGLSGLCQLSQYVEAGQCLALVHASDDERAAEAARAVLAAIDLGPAGPATRPVVQQRLAAA